MQVKLAPAAPAFDRWRRDLVLLGDAAVRTGDPAGAVAHLEAAMTAPAPRTRRSLSQALLAVAVTRLDADDVAGASASLVRADEVEGTPAVWRNLGLCAFLLGNLNRAETALKKAAAAQADAPTLRDPARPGAGGQGRCAGGRGAGPRGGGEAKGGPLAVDVAIERAASSSPADPLAMRSTS